MLTWLAEYEASFGPLRLFGYTSFRTVGASLTGFVLMLIVMPRLISWLRYKRFGEQGAKGDGAVIVDEMRAAKAGTPTMGGLGLIGCLLITGLLWCAPGEPRTWLLLATAASFGALGYLDDRTKVFKSAHGVPKRVKLLLQLGVGLALGLWFWSIDRAIIVEGIRAVQNGHRWEWLLSSSTLVEGFVTVPFTPAGGAIFVGLGLVIWTVLVTSACANSVNFTDGMDGLAAGTMLIASLAFMVIAYLASHFVAAHYLGILHVPGSQEAAVFCGAMAGACLGFLWFNAPPARVFMGDTGSQALGGVLAMVSIISKQEFLILLVGFVFFAEGLSVLVQVISFRTTGRRVLRCAPVHHHFQYLGWPETRIVVRFWVIAAIAAIAALATLKLR